jgi:hypothetical protein
MAHTYFPGLVLHLDAATLRKAGGTYTCPDTGAVVGLHFFVCIEASAKTGAWVPLYSIPGTGRILLESAVKRGHEKWTAGNSYYYNWQLWFAPHRAIGIAAKAGGDLSTSNAPNTIAPEAIPKRDEFPR